MLIKKFKIIILLCQKNFLSYYKNLDNKNLTIFLYLLSFFL